MRRLLDRSGVELALFAGDDRTDLDAFSALRSLVHDGELRAAACIGVASAEAPTELARKADVVVEGPEGMLDVIRALELPVSGDAGRAAR